MGNYRPVEGDRVRVVLEGTVTIVSSYEATVRVGSGENFAWVVPGDKAVSVEKIEPPVTVFKPGDVVRAKDNPKMIFVVARGGYLDLYNRGVWNKSETEFTSGCFEPVSLG